MNMTHLEKTIDVNVPTRTAYNQWTQFEEFPRFMEGVRSVRQLDDRTLRWRVEIGGKPVEWTAIITQQQPDRVIAWQSTSGARNVGTVSFQPVGPDQCRIRLELDYEPEGAIEKTGSAIGVVSARVASDLERFKKFIEARGAETGGWRARIQGGTVEPGAE
jgi:uncharacterized membrane protein